MKRNLMMLLALCICVGCTDVQPVVGAVIDRETDLPIANATVVVTYTGKTRLRDLWFHPLTGAKEFRCLRMITTTDDSGTFRTEAQKLGAYFGDPHIRLKAFVSRHRDPVERESRALNESGYVVEMWSETSADRYNPFTAEVMDYQAVEHPESVRAKLKDEALYLGNWLAGGGLVDSCEYEPQRREFEDFMLDRFEQWSQYPNVEDGKVSLGCDALKYFDLKTRDPVNAERLNRIRERARFKCVGKIGHESS